MSESRRSSAIRDRMRPEPHIALRLTERDLKLLTEVALHRAVTREQLMSLGFFSSVSRATRRLRSLFDAHYLRRTFVASGPYNAHMVHVLGPAALDLVVTSTGIERPELQRQIHRDPARTFLEHSLACLDVRVAIEKAVKTCGQHLVMYLPEPLCRHEYSLVKRGRETRMVLKPDAFFQMKSRGVNYSAFVEVDLGHVSSHQMELTFRRYQHYLEDHAFAEVYGASAFEVLVITTAGERRIRHLAALAPTLQPVVRFSTLQDLQKSNFFGSIWRSDRGKRTSLLEHLSPVIAGGRP